MVLFGEIFVGWNRFRFGVLKVSRFLLVMLVNGFGEV